MATDYDDILIDQDGEDLVSDGDFAIGDGKLDDCYVNVKLNKGECKIDPTLGPNLVRMMNAAQTVTEMKQDIMSNLRQDNKEPSKLEIVDGNIELEI